LLALESVTHLIAPILSSASAERLRRLRQGEEIGHFEGALRHKQGHSVPLNVASKMLHVGERPRYISVMHDITARQRAEVALRKSQARLAGILDIADDAIVAVNGRHEIELFNQGAERIFGYVAGEVIGQPLDMLLPESVAATHRQNIEVFAASADVARRMGERQDIFGRRRDGTEFPAEASISKLTAKDEPLFTVILRDITARKQIETRLRASVREKEILLQEVHHRVKNNLQIIQSLLRLQAYAVGDPALHELFRDSQNRVHAMALVHEQLYGVQDVAHVDCSAYLHELAVSVLRSYEVQSARIVLAWAIDSALAVDINTAIPLGLIMTELVSNSLKHAFPAGRTGTITVGLHDDSASLVMTVRDDGIGLSSNTDARTTNSLGIQLVGDLTEQLGGTVRVDCQPGTTFQICIPHAPNLNKE
jgi:PAS domain S-box-containing protein